MQWEKYLHRAYETHKQMEARLHPVTNHDRQFEANAIDLTTRSPEVQSTVQNVVPRAVAVPRVQPPPQEKQPEKQPVGKPGSLFNMWKQQQEPSGAKQLHQ